METVRPIQELVVVGHLDLRWLRRLRQRHADSRAVFFHPGLGNERALGTACALSQRVIVQDDLASEFADCVRGGAACRVERLSAFDPRLARRCPKRPAGADLSPAANGVFAIAEGPVLFCPSNDTHTKLFEPIARRLSNAGFLLHDHRPEERAREMMETLDLPYVDGGPEMLEQIRPSAIVVGNDWYDGVWALFQRAYELAIPTICIQEGSLDFASRPRMQHCDYAFMQGPIMLDHLTHDIYLLTGNPRFDQLAARPLPKHPVAMLNCNFTYGVEEQTREGWIEAAAQACQSAGLDFFVSQHPRDRGEFRSIPLRSSNAGVVHDHIADSSILVTRFSTLVYEALLCGREVVYYNPHGEAMRLFNEDRTGSIHIARDREGLSRVLARAMDAENDPIRPNRREAFLALHCGERDGKAASRCAAGLASVARFGHPRLGRRLRDAIEMRRYRRRRKS